MPSCLCYKGSKNADMLICMSVSSSTFIRLDGQSPIILSFGWCILQMNTEVCRRRKQPIENYLHTVLQITVVLDITGECFGTGSGETVQSIVPCTECTGQPHAVCTPYRFTVCAFTFSPIKQFFLPGMRAMPWARGSAAVAPAWDTACWGFCPQTELPWHEVHRTSRRNLSWYAWKQSFLWRHRGTSQKAHLYDVCTDHRLAAILWALATHFGPARNLHQFVVLDGGNCNWGFWHCSAAARRMFPASESSTELLGDINSEPHVVICLLWRRVVWWPPPGEVCLHDS